MKTKVLEYQTYQQLELFVNDNNFNNKLNLLIQVFTSQYHKEFISSLSNYLIRLLPNAQIIGATTAGEISNNGILKNSTVISFSYFSNTTIQTNILEYKESSFITGKNLMRSFNNYNSKDLKLLITFTDGLNTNGEEFLNGISSINNNVIVAGGMAGDNSRFKETFVFTKDKILSKGAVGVAFYNKDLSIYTDYSFNWETIGKKHIIEKSNKNRVYQINGMTTVEFYSHYLGKDIGRLLPSVGIEFPLVLKQNNINIGRAVLAKHNDGSLSFAGNMPEGSEVQFGHGDVQMIIDKGLQNIKQLIQKPIESIFIYSCVGRYSLLKDDVNLEILPMREIAPISGFFTYGEFYHDKKNNLSSNKLLNQTMTSVAISETTTTTEQITPNVFSDNPTQINCSSLHRTQAISNLIERTTKELEKLNSELELRIKKEVAKNIEKDDFMKVMKTQAQLGDMLEMILHQWRQPLSAITSSTSSLQIYRESNILTDEMLDNALENILIYSDSLNNTIDDFRDLFGSKNKLSNISLSTIINKSLTIISPLLKKENIKLDKELNEDAKVSVNVGLIMQVLLNIIKNASDVLLENNIKEPIIKIKTYVKKERCVIKIMDNGGGIPKNILPQIFEKGFSTKGTTHGTGLGLNMSRTIIENKVGGKLTANNVGEWAVFNIKIPII